MSTPANVFTATGRRKTSTARILAKALSAHEIDALGTWHWEIWGRDEQLAPAGNWRVWMICAGRGFGKTRAAKKHSKNRTCVLAAVAQCDKFAHDNMFGQVALCDFHDPCERLQRIALYTQI